MLVVDASVLVVALADDGERGDRARSRLDDEELTAPELVDLEVLSVVRRALHHGEVSAGRADAAVETLARLSLERVPHRSLAARCWELRENLTPYDAAYVALAETLGAVLVTADAPLARAPGSRCVVELLPVGGSLP